MSASGSRPKLELGECTALDEETKEECTCTEFVDFKKTSLCGTCYHYRQNHLQPAPETKKDVQSILAGMVPSGSLFGVTLGSLSKARKQLTLTGASSSARAKAANHESNRGMRPVRDSSGKGKAKVQEAKEDRFFKVVSIYILTCGTEFVDGVRQIPGDHQTIPDRLDVQSAALNGLAVLRENEGIVLDRTWSHEELVGALHEYFPEVFAYFEQLFQDSMNDGSEPRPVWHLATIAHRRLKVAPVKFPTGANADYNKGAGTTGWRNNRLWIVSRDPIPSKICMQWANPDTLDFVDPATKGAQSDAETDSDDERTSSEPQPTQRRSKRRAATTDTDEHKRKKKKSSAAFDLPPIFTDVVAKELTGSVIDLTRVDDASASHSTPVTPPPKPNPVNPKYSEEFKVDPTLGDPYAQNKKYTF
ncbi:hypothetical protein B0H16DRAFT_1888324 [Mycena metata]|uniref:Uncharacterized protein n=1 Tax=Mycena metata TaxID=1033252 RepID=A0AAD7N7J6_9AGAR|nr:hypothetical protein B0H16DRAFT_1888324 [Mycena metata]